MKLEMFIKEDYQYPSYSDRDYGSQSYDRLDLPTLELNRLLKNDCKEYFSLIGNKTPLFRGEYRIKTKIAKAYTHNNRRPSGTASQLFSIFNLWLSKSGHLSRSLNIVIATSSYKIANDFGNPYYVFPIGSIEYSWIEAKDVNLPDKRTGWSVMTIPKFFGKLNTDAILNPNKFNPIGNEQLKSYNIPLKKPFEDYFHTNEGFDRAYSNEYEIWFKCNSYYIVSARWFVWSKNQLWYKAQ